MGFIPGHLTRVLHGTGSNVIGDEDMEEVDLTTQGHPEHTVYEISDAAKRYLVPGSVPVFQADDAGNEVFASITPDTIHYAGGRIFLSAALGATDEVRCHTGNYYTIAQWFACARKKWSDKTESIDVTSDDDDAHRRQPGLRDWSAQVSCFLARKEAELTTTGGNANSHLRYVHALGGTDGNSIHIIHSDPAGANQDLSVSVVATTITVSLATDGDSAITSTAGDIATLLNADPDVQALGVRALFPPGETGIGVVAALGSTDLTGGLDAIDYASLKGSAVVVIFYDDYDNDARHEGFGLIDSIDVNADPADGVIFEMTISGEYQELHFHE